MEIYAITINKLVRNSTNEINLRFAQETTKFTKKYLEELKMAELVCKPDQVKAEKEEIFKLFSERIDSLLDIPLRTHKFFETELSAWLEEDAKRAEKQDQ